MSGDEFIATLAGIALGPVAWIWWLVSRRAIDELRPGRRTRGRALLTSVFAGALIIQATLGLGAADDVRFAPQYHVMYLALGLAWMFCAAFCFQFLGLHSRDDLIERGNPAALPAWSGALAGVALCYAGGNIGNGPGWFVVIFSAGLATAVLALAWLLVGRMTGLVDAVVLDRDPAAGWRLGGFLAAVGLISGFGVTGDWVSPFATVADLALRAWPILALALVAMLVENAARPTVAKPRGELFGAGVVPAAVYLTLAAAVVVVEWPRP